jgi:hypothetical protein
MTNNGTSDIGNLIVIAGRNLEDRLLAALSDKGCHIMDVVYGKGTVSAGYLLETFGLAHEENKVIVSCLISYEDADAIIAMLVGDFHFDKPNTGVAYMLPVEQLAY